jgi:ArsR family transcriptional regulator, arsenate/arsenite/antimonite-responsive transcriptional repressor
MKLDDKQFSRIAKALADPQRCQILARTAATGERCCSEIVAECPVSQATISHHLKELANADLLERRKEGQFVYFRYRPDVMRAYVEELGRRMCLPIAPQLKKETVHAVVVARPRPRS